MQLPGFWARYTVCELIFSKVPCHEIDDLFRNADGLDRVTNSLPYPNIASSQRKHSQHQLFQFSNQDMTG